MSRSAKLACLLIAVLAAVMLLVNLEGPPLRPYDEGLYGRLARNALATGTWMHAVEADGSFSNRLSKPPLSVWLTGLSLGTFGPSVWALRLPFALGAWLGICVCMVWGVRAQGARVGLCWGAALTLCGATLRWGRYACIEPMFVAFGMLALWGHAESLVASGRRSLAWAALAGFGLTLAFMTKQLAVGLFVVPLLVVEFVAFRSQQGASGGHRLRRWLLSAGTPIVLCGAWLGWMWTTLGSTFVEVFFRRSIGERVLGFSDAHNQAEANELGDLVAEVTLPFPWVLGVLAALLMPALVRLCARGEAERAATVRQAGTLFAWSMSALMLTGLLLYDQVSSTLLPWYAVGLVTPLLAGVAWLIARVPELDADAGKVEWLAAGLGMAALAMAVIESLGVYVSRLGIALGIAGVLLLMLRERSAGRRARDVLVALAFAAILLGKVRDEEFRLGPAPYSQLMRELGGRGIEVVAVDRNTHLRGIETNTYFGPRAELVDAPPWQRGATGIEGLEAYVSAELPPEQLVPPAGVELLRVGGAVAWISAPGEPGGPGTLEQPPWSRAFNATLLDAGALRFEAEHMPSERADTLHADADASGGWARAVLLGRHREGDAFFLSVGPRWRLERGSYRAVFRVRWHCPRPAMLIGRLAVVGGGRQLRLREIRCEDGSADDWRDIALDFELQQSGPVELGVVYETGTLWYDYGTIALR